MLPWLKNMKWVVCKPFIMTINATLKVNWLKFFLSNGDIVWDCIP